MAKEENGGALVEAAAALERELRRFENMAETAEQGRLTSERALQRSASVLQEAGQSEGRLGAALQGLLAAITTARERQLAAAQRLVERGEEIKARADVLQDLVERLEALGREGGEINASLQKLNLERRDAAASEHGEPGALLEPPPSQEIATAVTRMGQAADDAKALAHAAREAEFPDVAQQAESLRQQILAARNKLSLLQRH